VNGADGAAPFALHATVKSRAFNAA